MNYYSITIDKKYLDSIKKYYNDYLQENDKKYLFFKAVKDEIIIECFLTGTIVVKGKNYSKEIEQIELLANKVDFEAIGSDEVGTGDIFGPIVVCSCFLSLENIKDLKKYNIRDSKIYTDEQIIKYASIILNKIKPIYSVVILKNQKYNELVFKNKFNMNKIKAILHNHVIYSTYRKVNKDVKVILDQFCLETNYFEYLKNEKYVFRDIEFKTRAERYHVSVACASIIARYVFLKAFQSLSKNLNMELKKGASNEVCDQFKLLKDKYGIKSMSKIAKLNFKNIK